MRNGSVKKNWSVKNPPENKAMADNVYMKRIAAIRCSRAACRWFQTMTQSGIMLNQIDHPLTRETDVKRRITEMRLGDW